MPTYENIEGEKLLQLFERLINQQTLVNVSLPSTDFESLTVLTDTRKDGEILYFKIDLPDGLIASMSKSPPELLSFEFTGEGQLTHRFDAKLKDISESSIWLHSPDVIQRYQMRDNFRIKVMRESFATFETKDGQVNMEIDNISVGGVYCYCPNLHKPLMESYPIIKDLKLQVTAKTDCFSVPIEQALVKRLEPWMRPKHFGVAFEFVQINRQTRKQLIQHIYDLQREFLQNRLKLDE